MWQRHSTVTREEPVPAELAGALLENLPDAVVACDRDGGIILRNRRAREFTQDFPAGSTPGEMPLLRALHGEEVRDVEIEMPGVAGVRCVNISGSPVRDERGRIEGAVIVMQDVTRRVQAEARRRLHSVIIERIGVGVALVRVTDGEIVYANGRWEAMFGYSPGELLGRHISSVNAPTSRTPEQVAQEILDGLERRGVWSGEIQNLRRDGAAFWTSCSVSRLDHPQHGPVWVLVNTDITARRSADEALRISEVRFRESFENLPVAAALISNDRMTVANRAFCDLVGYGRDELEAKALSDITHPEDAGLDTGLWAKMIAGEIHRYRIEKRIIRKNGESLPVVLTRSVARSPDGALLHGIAVIEEVIPTG